MSPSTAGPSGRRSPLGETTVEDTALVAEVVIAAFRLHDRLTDAAGCLAEHGQLTSSEWQVLGGVLDEPRTLAEIGRRMGITRQGARRVGAVLLACGLIEARPNPAHARADLYLATSEGREAVERIGAVQRPWAASIVAHMGVSHLRAALTTLDGLAEVVEQTGALSRPLGKRPAKRRLKGDHP